MAQEYNNTARILLTEHAPDISQFVLDTDDVEVLEDIDTEQQHTVARRTDSTKRIRVDGHEAILHIELQLRDSTHRPMWARNAEYQGYLVGQHQLPVYTNAIYFHRNAGKNDPGKYEYSWNGYVYTLHYKVIRLSQIDGKSILERQAPGLLPFTPLMRRPAGMNLDRWVQECVDATLAAPVDQGTRADLLYGISVFGGVVYDSQLFDRNIPEELMIESKTYQQQRGRIIRETTVKHILALLKRRFQAEAVDALQTMLLNITDLQKLEDLLFAASEVPNIDAFAQMLNE